MSKRNDALAAMLTTTPQPETTPPAEPAPKPERKTVANSSKRVMLYLPPKAKRKFKEIAFFEERKEHTVYIEALRDYLEKHGHSGLL